MGVRSRTHEVCPPRSGLGYLTVFGYVPSSLVSVHNRRARIDCAQKGSSRCEGILHAQAVARAFCMLQSSLVYPLKHWQSPEVASHIPRLLHWLTYSYCLSGVHVSPSESADGGVKWKSVTIPVLSDHMLSRVAPVGFVLEFSGSPSSPRHPMLMSTSIILVSTECLSVGVATASTVVAGVVVEFAPSGAL